MNARQKVKKLKKELKKKNQDDIRWIKKVNGHNSFTWLKIDGIGIKREEPQLFYENNLIEYREMLKTYVIQIGSMRFECTPENPEDLLYVINSKEFDEAIKQRKQVN